MTKVKKVLRVYTIDGRYYMFVGSYAEHMLKVLNKQLNMKVYELSHTKTFVV